MSVGAGSTLAGVAASAAVLVVLVGARRHAVRRRSRARLEPLGAARRSDARRRFLLGHVLLGGGVLLLGWIRATLLVCFALVAWWARTAQRRKRADVALSRALPQVLDAIVGVLRSGGSLLEGVATAHAQPLEPTVRGDLGLVLSEVDRGRNVVAALSGWAERRDDRDLRTLAAVTAAATATGGPLAAALARIAATLRQRQAQGREIEALVGQARLSAMVLVVLPVGVLPLLDVLGAVRIQAVLTDPVSRAAVVAGVGLDLIGLVWMRRLVAGVHA